jgi:two-component system, chemotaxis family, chemotaxis protein CheY
MKILIVDDSRAMRNIVRRRLREAGFENHTIEEAGNGAEALTHIKAAAPDLVMSDFNMPEMNGLQLLQKLRADGLQTKFGFVTSEGSDELKAAATGAGALFVIVKPFSPEMFQQVLGPLLS